MISRKCVRKGAAVVVNVSEMLSNPGEGPPPDTFQTQSESPFHSKSCGVVERNPADSFDPLSIYLFSLFLEKVLS